MRSTRPGLALFLAIVAIGLAGACTKTPPPGASGPSPRAAQTAPTRRAGAKTSPPRGRAMAPARAATPPRALRLQERAFHNMHTHFGAQGSSLHTDVRLAFPQASTARLVDDGRRRSYVSHARAPGGNDSDETRWKRTWEGRATPGPGRLQLDLRLRRGSCQRTKTVNGRAQRLACPGVGPRLQLTCTDGKIKVDGPEPRSKEVWICTGAGAREPGHVVRWVFGKTACLRRTGGVPLSGPNAYELCR